MRDKLNYRGAGFFLLPAMLALMFCGSVYAGHPAGDEVQSKKEIMKRAFGIQLPFIANEGQIHKDASFYAKIFGGTLYVTGKGEMVYSLPRISKVKTTDAVKKAAWDKKAWDKKIDVWVLKENLLGAYKIHPKGMDKAKTQVSYFKGNDKKKWKSNISTYNSLSLGRVYDGIDLSLKAYGKNVEKIFTIYPAGSVSDIRLKIDGASSLKSNLNGELEIQTGLGPVRFSAPLAYQVIDGKRKTVNASYDVKGNTYGFRVAEYDRRYLLIIDPLLASTFIGGISNDYGYSITLDSSNNVYITGSTWSPDFPTTSGAYDETYNDGSDVFVSKLNSNLTTLLSSAFLGGSSSDTGYSITLDSSNNVYIAGYVCSSDFPTTSGAYDETYNGGGDVFVSKLNIDLTVLSASTFIGGVDYDKSSSIAIDSSNNVYIIGETKSSDFPTTFYAYNKIYNGGFYDVFVSRLNNDLTTLSASTFLGGANTDTGDSITLDSSNNVYITGFTSSSDFPTTVAAFDDTNDGGDVFVSRLNSNLTILSASTFLGGTDGDSSQSITIDSSNNVYITGRTDSSDFPTTSGAYDETYNGGGDAFVSRLNSVLTDLEASTFLGGSSDNDRGRFITLDSSNNVYITGDTSSSDFPTTVAAFDDTYNGGLYDVFVSKLNSDLTVLSASTFLGGVDYDYSHSIAIDSSNNVYIIGETKSSDFPTTAGAYDETYDDINYAYDVFVSKLDGNLSAPLPVVFVNGDNADAEDGNSWNTGWNTIQKGLDAADADDKEVWVKDCTYNESITLKDGVDLYGGFNGTETALGQRNWVTNVTTIDATTVPAPNHVVTGADNATIDGFTITGGKADGGGNNLLGGGMFNNGVSPVVTNCIFTDNWAGSGGGMFNITGSNPTVTNCVFSNNSANTGGSGGGMGNHSSSPVITNCTFSNNSALTAVGGGISNYDSSPVITNCILWGNSASTDPEIHNGGTSAPSVTYSDVEGGYSGTGNIDADPKFVGGGDYHIQAGSPCIDAANSTDALAYDLDGNSRFDDLDTTNTGTGTNGNYYDIGAYEYQGGGPATYSLTINISPGGTGSVTASGINCPGDCTEDFDSGTDVTLTATPEDGYEFDCWSGDLTGSGNPDTVTMDGNKSITAVFAAINQSPSSPTAKSPANEAIFASGPVTLEASAFLDPEGDTHTESHWLIKRADSVYYRSDYDASFNTVATTGDLTQHTVSGLSSGMKYVWKVGYKDSGSGETSWSQEYSFKIGVSETDTMKIYAGTEVKDYKMVSFTQWPDNPAAESVFNVDYSSNDFRIGTYDPEAGGYIEYGNNLKIEPGKSYWVLARNGLDMTINGVPVSLYDDIEVKLNYNSSPGNGWNMIACPNKANYYWDNVIIIEYDSAGNIIYGPMPISELSDTNEYIDRRLWSWSNGSYYSDTTLMEKYEGYWVKAKKPNISLRFSVSAQAKLSDPEIMMANIMRKGKHWIKSWIFAQQEAIADSGDSPPQPMGDFSSNPGSSASSGTNSGGGSCFIATAAYGSPMQPHVRVLKDFRDTYLLSWEIGRKFVTAYYKYSPPLADCIVRHNGLRTAVRISLLPVVGLSYVALHYGMAFTIIGLLMIFAFKVCLISIYRKRNGKG